MVANKQEHHHHHHHRQHHGLWAFGAISVSRKKKDGMGLPNLNTPSTMLDHGGKQARASSPSSSPSTSRALCSRGHQCVKKEKDRVGLPNLNTPSITLNDVRDGPVDLRGPGCELGTPLPAGSCFIRPENLFIRPGNVLGANKACAMGSRLGRASLKSSPPPLL